VSRPAFSPRLRIEALREPRSTGYLGGMDVCAVCGGGLPEVAVRTRDPFCSTACAREHFGTGSRSERERASRQQRQKALEEGTDPASLELRRVTVDERQRLIAEGRFVDEFLRAFREHLIAHKPPVTTATVTWFSPRGSGPVLRLWDDDDEEPWYQPAGTDAA
jgi:hypothetical protein